MAAKLPVVSTTVGAEGLPVENGKHIAIADNPELFAKCCLDLLENEDRRREMAAQAWQLVCSRFSWDAVTREFEAILEAGPRPEIAVRLNSGGSEKPA
jgi:glycosyltransferase involved in cell wall biosynthesis